MLSYVYGSTFDSTFWKNFLELLIHGVTVVFLLILVFTVSPFFGVFSILSIVLFVKKTDVGTIV